MSPATPRYPHRRHWLGLGLLLIFSLGGCSSDRLKRNAYQALQDLEMQRCGNDPGQYCPPPQSYDDYQRQRAE